jgi:hypothetical protein
MGRSSCSGRVKNFLLSTSSRPVLGPTQPPIQCVPAALSPGVKRQGREADHSPPASAEIKKMWIYTSTPPYAFMAYCLIKHIDKLPYLYLPSNVSFCTVRLAGTANYLSICLSIYGYRALCWTLAAFSVP